MKRHEAVLVSAVYEQGGTLLTQMDVRDPKETNTRRINLIPTRVSPPLELGGIVRFYEKKGRFSVRNKI